ncbi:N-acetylmuramoyl-L-alanine amidase [Tropicimonas aquimaris]|uniref:N-acetylmuramoyl-L-alanine amidase n=1 Tax=Tropicimonas aquimaris TaxID=914152 RepID=A0ABW3IM76_9RHOB
MQAPSPNVGPRRGGVLPDMVVLHYTAMASAEAALERLCDPEAEVSCHYLIGRDGRCWRLVDEAERAWHAGAGSWGGRADVNSHSIGIELDNPGDAPFSEPLMATLERLLPEIFQRWGIAPHRVIAHSDMAPARKLDPGPRFDWRRLAIGGLACWPKAGAAGEGVGAPEVAAPPAVDAGAPAPQEAAFRAALVAFGYPDEVETAPLLAAFRSRFRPWATGSFQAADLALAMDLAHRFPIDRAPVTA